ncbi:MAG: pentapeptide repeat-containing protein [Sphaerochaeta sp.]|nr:pentapeptide repeat-containing protein [Sphaerochaeta sp.]
MLEKPVSKYPLPLFTITKARLAAHEKFLNHQGGRRLEVLKASRIRLADGIRGNALVRLVKAYFYHCDFTGIPSLRGVVFDGADLVGSIFSGVDLTAACFMGADISFSKFVGCKMTGANLMRVKGQRVNFAEAVIEDSSLEGACIHNGNFAKATMRHASMSRGDFEESTFNGATLSHSYMTGSYFRGCRFEGAAMRDIRAVGSDFSNGFFARANLSDANLSYSTLCGASFWLAIMDSINLTGVDGNGINLRQAMVTNANFSRANVSNVDLQGADVTGAIAREGSPVVDSIHYETEGERITKGLKDLLDVAVIAPEGELIVYKALRNDRIATLRIPAGAARVSVGARKCRAAEAFVISIVDFTGHPFDAGVSIHDSSFVYRVGKTVRPEQDFVPRALQCADGIHFFLTRSEAVDYAKVVL